MSLDRARSAIPFYRRRSALELFACPFAFKARYIDGVQDESSPARRGSAFHEVLRRYVLLLVQCQCSDDLDLAREAFRVGIAASMVPEAIIAEVDQLWWRFVPTFHLDVDSVLHVEERPDDAYRWRPDLVRAYSDTLEITDFKTYWSVMSEAAARAAFQSRFYSARARVLWPGFAHYRFQFWFVRWGVIVAIEFEPADLDRHDEHLQLLEAGIETAIATNHFPAVPGESCSYCRLECPVASDARVHPIRVTTPTEAQQALGEYLVLKNAADARRLALEDYCRFEGPVALNGIEVAHRAEVATSFPADAVFSVFQAHGLTPSFSISKTALKPWLTTRRYRHVVPDLEAVQQDRIGTAFRVKKVGDVAIEADAEAAEGPYCKECDHVSVAATPTEAIPGRDHVRRSHRE